MKRFLSLTLCLSLLAFAGTALAASGSATDGDGEKLHFTVPGETVHLHSATSNEALRFKQAALSLYGE